MRVGDRRGLSGRNVLPHDRSWSHRMVLSFGFSSVVFSRMAFGESDCAIVGVEILDPVSVVPLGSDLAVECPIDECPVLFRCWVAGEVHAASDCFSWPSEGSMWVPRLRQKARDSTDESPGRRGLWMRSRTRQEYHWGPCHSDVRNPPIRRSSTRARPPTLSVECYLSVRSPVRNPPTPDLPVQTDLPGQRDIHDEDQTPSRRTTR